MSRVFVTGSADGLGRLAAYALSAAGHDLVVHARNPHRAVPSTSWLTPERSS
jgi:NAD(P)-dependent dehydrogenase (short-subunit alcohol dehydrogenase family)